ncbi:MAG: hypothetical protein IJK03_06650, partial [Oscillospiraceae bacterium]|nr:hypothetical protein [Oscillospiraceae bacterium]
LTDDQMNKIVEFYRAWCAMNGRDLGNNENDVAAPVRGGLASVVAAVPALGGGGADHAAQVHDGGGGGGADPAVPVLDGDGGGGEAEIAEPSEAAVEIPSSPPPESDSSEPEAEVREELPKDTVSTERIGGTIQRAAAPAPPNGGRYHGSSFTSKFQRGLGIYNAVVSAGNLVNTRAKFGVMMDHYRHHHAGDNSTGPWDLRHSSGNYHQYTDWVAPIAGGSLNVLSGIGGLLGLGTGLRQTVRHVQNQKVGAHKADAAISSLDLISGVGKTASSIWSAVHNFSSIGKYAGLAKGAVGNATQAIPGLSIATGALDTGVGAWQAIRAGRSWSKINGALQQIRQPAAPGSAAPAPAPRQAWNRQTDQQKLEDIFKHGRSTQKINTLSGSLKATQGLLTAAAGGATLGGALPVAAGFQGLAAITGIVKTAFERGLKRRLHKRVVAEDLNINWDREIDDVRTMMQMYNKNYNMRDKYVRQIILQAHGSDQKTFQEAYGKIKTKRANYLMSIARDQRNRYNQAAATVVEAMGVHKVNGAFVQGAEKLLAEKLG